MYLIFSGSGIIVHDVPYSPAFASPCVRIFPQQIDTTEFAHDMSVALVEPSVYLQSLLPIPRSPLLTTTISPDPERTILPSSILPSSQTLPSPHLTFKSNRHRPKIKPAPKLYLPITTQTRHGSHVPRPPYWPPAPLNPRHGSSPDFTTQLCIHWH